MSNIFKYFITLIILTSCSLDTKSGIWSEKKNIIVEKIISKKIFIKEEILDKEFNSKLKIKLTTRLTKNSFGNNPTNNNGRVDYNGKLKKISKFKYSKISNFKYHEPELIFEGENLFFFDKKGTIIKFNPNSKIIWKKNFYNKQEKKLSPILNFAKNSTTLIVADNISKYYGINIDNGDLFWSKNNSSPLNSQIKTYKDKFFIIDFNNVLKSFSIKDGLELWSLKSNDTFIKSEKKLSLAINNDILYFNNSIGDITAVDVNNGNMLWQTPTQNSTIFEDSFLLKTSNIVANNEMIIFSNNKNEFYAMDLESGNIKWKQKINSSVQPSIINNLIFTITNEGFLVILDSKKGNILRMTNLFENSNKNTVNKKNPLNFIDGVFSKIPEDSRFYVAPKGTIKKNNFKPTGFIVGKENIYLTTSHGRLLVIDILTGKTKSTLKIDNNKISRPFVLNNNLFLIKDDSIIKLD